MTREEEIINAGVEYTESRRPMCIGGQSYSYEIFQMNINRAFEEGAKYADSHPRKVYVVVRCEEHSDYVEKVFVDNDKAVAYCNKFNSPTSDEYCRVIEAMEVTL